VFVKRVSRAAVTGHNLLVKLTGRTLPASPRVYGIYQNGDKCLYFFQNLPASFRTLDEQLDNINVITPQLVRGVITKASGIFKVIERCGFVYIDFCAKNIMLDRESGGLAIIDIDSSWPATFLRNKKPDNQGQIEFWGLWNHTLSACIPVRVENAQKSVLLSFAAVWSRAIALKRRGTQVDVHSALTFVHNPSYERQRPLWDALLSKNQKGFLDYFIRGIKALPVYVKWQDVFTKLFRGLNIAWEDIIKATDVLLSAIVEKKTQQASPRVKRVHTQGKRQSNKPTSLKLSVIAQAEAEDMQRLSGNDFLTRLWQNNYSKFKIK
jgi:hypothetical protein